MIEKAVKYIRKNVDMEYLNFCVCHAMEMRCPFSLAYPLLADDISDLLEEYGEDNELAEAIEYEMSRWKEWLDNGDISQDTYNEQWWVTMGELGYNFGMSYYKG